MVQGKHRRNSHLVSLRSNIMIVSQNSCTPVGTMILIWIVKFRNHWNVVGGSGAGFTA